MGGKIVDYHQFEIWRYEDDSIDLHCSRDECPVDGDTILRESRVVARCLAEQIHDTEEVFALSVYNNGLTTTQWRGPDGFVQGWQRYKWTRERVSSGLHSGVVGYPEAPGWALAVLWWLEYALCRLTLRLGVWTGKYKLEPMDWTGDLAVDGLPAQPDPPPLPEGGNVVPFRKVSK